GPARPGSRRARAGDDGQDDVADGDHAAEAAGDSADAQHAVAHFGCPFVTGTEAVAAPAGARAAADVGGSGTRVPSWNSRRRTQAVAQRSAPTTPPGETSTIARKTRPSQVTKRSVSP